MSSVREPTQEELTLLELVKSDGSDYKELIETKDDTEATYRIYKLENDTVSISKYTPDKDTWEKVQIIDIPDTTPIVEGMASKIKDLNDIEDARLRGLKMKHKFDNGIVSTNKKTWTCSLCNKQISFVLKGFGEPSVSSNDSLPEDLVVKYLDDCDATN